MPLVYNETGKPVKINDEVVVGDVGYLIYAIHPPKGNSKGACVCLMPDEGGNTVVYPQDEIKATWK